MYNVIKNNLKSRTTTQVLQSFSLHGNYMCYFFILDKKN